MPTYPNLGQDINSTETVLDDVQLEYAANGKLRGRAFYAAPKKEFSVVHTCTTADKTTLESFYNTNRVTSFDFTWIIDNTSHTCRFKGPPQFSMIGGEFWTATVPLAKV